MLALGFLAAIGAAIAIALLLIHYGDQQSGIADGPQAAPPLGWKPTDNKSKAKTIAIAWEKFPELLKTGEVIGGESLHDGHVELHMKDGRRYSSVCPEGESLPALIEKHAPNQDIPIIME